MSNEYDRSNAQNLKRIADSLDKIATYLQKQDKRNELQEIERLERKHKAEAVAEMLGDAFNDYMKEKEKQNEN